MIIQKPPFYTYRQKYNHRIKKNKNNLRELLLEWIMFNIILKDTL